MIPDQRNQVLKKKLGFLFVRTSVPLGSFMVNSSAPCKW